MAPDGLERRSGWTAAGERKLVTVLFADIVASSRLVTGHDPEEADEALQTILRVLDAAVGRYRGMVAQELGDGILAMFGAPNAMEDHALRACLAAQDMVCAAAMSATPDGGPPSSFSVRVGIATGEVLSRMVENAARNDQRAIGECVHLAAKLQQKATPDAVLIAESTRKLAGDGVRTRPAGRLRLADDAAPVAVHRLVEVRPTRPTALNFLSSDSGPFFGRAPELATLERAWSDVETGRGRIAIISGEPGIGKSRLASELVRKRRDDGGGVVVWPQTAIRRLGEPDDLEGAATSLLPLLGRRRDGRERDVLAELAGPAAGPMAVCAMRDLLGLPVTDALWRGLEPPQRMTLAIEGLAAAIAELSRRRPLLVLVEDLHWAGEALRNVLQDLAKRIADARVLLLATTRDEAVPGWAAAARAWSLPLGALTAAQTDQYLTHWLGPHPSLADVKARMARKSQGMPLYLEESLRVLESDGVVAGRPGHYRLADPERPFRLPPNIRALIASRIDSLAEEPRATLMRAAVIGATFDERLLRRIAPVAESGLPGVLEGLEASGFIEPSRLLPNQEFRFRHALVQEVAYETLTRKDRRVLHAQVLNALRERRDGDLPGRLDLMAHHAFMAEEWAAACAYGRAAGRRAEQRSRLEDASRHFETALKALDRLPDRRRNAQRRVDLHTAIPRVYLPRGIPDFGDHLKRAVELARRWGDREREAQALSMTASFHWAHGELGRALTLCRQGLEVAAQTNSPALHINLTIRTGGILAETGPFAEASQTLKAAIDLSEFDCGRSHGIAAIPIVGATSLLARLSAETGDYALGERLSSQAMERAEESNHPFSRMFAIAHYGWVVSLKGDFDAAIPVLEDGMALCNLIRARLWLPAFYTCLAHCHGMLGRRSQAAQLFDEGFTLFHSNGDYPKVHAPQLYLWRSKFHLREMDVAAARHDAETALSLAVAYGERGHEARAKGLLAEIALKSLSLRNAERYLMSTMEVAADIGLHELFRWSSEQLANVGRMEAVRSA